jgi:hypothetical protein
MASEGAGAVGPPLGEMDLDEFRRAGHRIVDWIADYRAHPECYPVQSRCRPGEVRAQLPRAAPSEADSIECILNDFERLILPGITHWNHPGRRQACDEYLDRLNEAVLDAVNASGEAFLSHTKIRGRYAIRMTIGNINSDRAEVDRTWRLLRDEASRLDGEMHQEWLS